ncbi:MAG: hypothetical protein HYX69_01720 [Planctomycetia bacterium]|nr:hypothetical protein [Planctomycetia bacterium]
MPDDELISAYLDGELSGEDLARAEQLLATHPDSRQMLEELTALRASLRELPKHELGPDFAASVLRRAEREMLVPASAVAMPRPHEEKSASAGRPPVLSWARWQRPLIWSSLAVAAALVIMFLSPDERHQPQVAQAPAPAAPGRGEAAWDVAHDRPMALAQQHGEADSKSGVDAADRYARGGEQNPTSEAAGADGATSPYFALQLGDQEQVPLGAYLVQEDEKQAATGGALVVRCDVSPQVAGSDTFSRLLSQQQIVWQGAPESGRSNEAARDLEEKPPVAAFKVESDSKAAPEQQEAVYVEANPQQLRATLAALATNAEFRDVTVSQLPPSTDTRAWFYYAVPAEGQAAPAVPAAPAAVTAPGAAPTASDVADKAQATETRSKTSGGSAMGRKAKGDRTPADAAAAAKPAEGAEQPERQLFAGRARMLPAPAGRAYRVPLPAVSQFGVLREEEGVLTDNLATAPSSRVDSEQTKEKAASKLGVNAKQAAPAQNAQNEDYDRPDSASAGKRESLLRAQASGATRRGGQGLGEKLAEPAQAQALFIFRIVPEAAAAAPNEP